MRTTLIAALGLALALAAGAQPAPGPQPQTQSLKGVELKGKAPVNPNTLRVQLPKPQETTLANGLRVALLEDHKTPTFALHWVIDGGGLADPADKRGVAMATAALLREGAGKRTSRDIAEQLAALGASLSAGASPSSGETAVNVTGLSEHLDATLAIAADVLRRPGFPESELGKFRSRFLAQLQQQRSQPGFVAQEHFMRAIYGEHPGAYVVPPESVLKALERADLVAYHAAHYAPNNIVLIAHGDVTLKSLAAKLEKAFGDWPQRQWKQPPLPDLAAPAKTQVVLVNRPGSVQTSLWVGSLGIERNSDDYFPVLVMNHILGGGAASRLFLNLREDKGYTYGAYSSFSGSTFRGVMVANTDVRTDVTEGALKELTGELQRLIEEPVSKDELVNAQRALVGRFALSLDSPRALVENVAVQKIYDLPPDYWDTYPKHVDAVTPADIQRVAKKYFDPARLQIIAVGDDAAVREALENYGKVETATL